jgi:ribosomal protein S18 acetylase RimI-like enzyme
MKIVRLSEKIACDVARIWRHSFQHEGLCEWSLSDKPLSEKTVASRILEKESFDPAGSFVAVEGRQAIGFSLAVMSAEEGKRDGFLGVLAVEPRWRRKGVGTLLLRKAEAYLRGKGAERILTTFEHNPLALLPGVPAVGATYAFFLNQGYRSYQQEFLQIMKQELAAFRFSQKIRERICKLAGEGVRIGLMRSEELPVADKFLAACFPQWHHGIVAALRRGRQMIVAAQNGKILGFSGPYSVRKSGRGDFHAIGVDPAAQSRGLGAALFSVMTGELRKGGAQYVLLTTELNNPAQEIYVRCGYRTKYVVDYGMRKSLTEKIKQLPARMKEGSRAAKAGAK